MKKVIFSMIAVVIMALTFVSCGNSGNNGGDKGNDKQQQQQEQQQQQGLVGEWYYNDNTYYIFNEDGTGSSTAYGVLVGNFTYSVGDGKLTLNYEGFTEPTIFNIKVEGKTLTILSGEGNIGSEVEYTRK
jgi:hypothetical protein